jgi:hypothetical protein
MNRNPFEKLKEKMEEVKKKKKKKWQRCVEK